MAAVVVTHDAQLASWADRVVFLRDGQIVDQTMPPPSPESLLEPAPTTDDASPLERPQPASRPGNGGAPARRAMVRWAWRLFRREWRQQLLILALVVVAVAATVVGAAVATNTPPPANAGFGTAQDAGHAPRVRPRTWRTQIAACEHRFGPRRCHRERDPRHPGLDRDLSSCAPRTPRARSGGPMLSLVSGHYPTGPGQVAVTDGVASAFNLHVGDLWHQGGTTRRVVGIVENPQSLLDEFALVAPGQVHAPTQVTVLFDAAGRRPVQARRRRPDAGVGGRRATRFNPETIVLALATARDAADRPGVGRRLHGPRPAAAALDRDARRRSAPPTGTSVSSCGPTASSSASSERWSARRWAWSPGWPTGRSLEPSSHHLIGAVRSCRGW